MSLGAEQSGIKVVAAVENDVWAAQTHSWNFRNAKTICKDIREVKAEEIWIGERTEPLVIFGGPPCRGFSTSNQKTRTLNNPSNWLFTEYIRIIAEILPEWVVFENVKGIIETEDGVFLNQILESLERLGYNLVWKVLNAVDYGVPQTRSRLFIIGTLQKKCEISFSPPLDIKPVTVRDAISDLPVLSVGANVNELPYKCKPVSEFARERRGNLLKSTNHFVTKNSLSVTERYKHIPQGGNWENIPDFLMKNYKDRSRCHTGIYYRLENTMPSVVIGNYRKNMLVHPTQNRGLSVREAARLQSFPDWFDFKGSIGFQQQQVGNSVPPLLAKAVFDAVRKSSRA